MNLLYLSMWGVDDGLTASTVFPHLNILSKLSTIDKIYFISYERNSTKVEYRGPKHDKIVFVPIYGNKLFVKFLNQISAYLFLPIELAKFCRVHKVDSILARGAPAGAIASMVHKKTSIPYMVESFEPHSQYMLESGVWHRWSLQYIFQKIWEERQKKTASALMPVSYNYKFKLLSEGVNPDKLHVIPCCVDMEIFSYQEKFRFNIRDQLSIHEKDIVGIYVGKFGGIYYNEEAFNIFKKAFDFWGEQFKLIILSPQSKIDIQLKLVAAHIAIEKVSVLKVSHKDIPKYLSASDFAFSLAKPSESKKYLSPIKDGEYWANGLPIMIPEDIGDDSDIVMNTPLAGTVFTLSDSKLNECFQTIKQTIVKYSRGQRGLDIAKIAEKYRNFSSAKSIYAELFKDRNVY